MAAVVLLAGVGYNQVSSPMWVSGVENPAVVTAHCDCTSATVAVGWSRAVVVVGFGTYAHLANVAILAAGGAIWDADAWYALARRPMPEAIARAAVPNGPAAWLTARASHPLADPARSEASW